MNFKTFYSIKTLIEQKAETEFDKIMSNSDIDSLSKEEKNLFLKKINKSNLSTEEQIFKYGKNGYIYIYGPKKEPYFYDIADSIEKLAKKVNMKI